MSVSIERLRGLAPAARKLLAMIAQQAHHGPLAGKPSGVATPPEILEACGLDVGEFYTLLNKLEETRLIRVASAYPFEEIRLTSEGEEALRDSRYWEDYTAGQVYEFGTITVSEAEIVEFARRFDPQYFHVDPERAKSGPFGGIVASGWHTISLAMRMYVDHYLSHPASLASPGVEDIRWPNPVRPGDSLRVRTEILDARPSRSKPDRGIVRARVEARNQRDELVLSMIAVSFLRRRE